LRLIRGYAIPRANRPPRREGREGAGFTEGEVETGDRGRLGFGVELAVRDVQFGNNAH
jgi:hypothetical protein